MQATIPNNSTEAPAYDENGTLITMLSLTLLAVGKKLKTMLTAQRDNYLMAYYEVGELAHKALEKEFGAHYGDKFVHRLAETAEINLRTLYHCLSLVVTWDRAKYTKLIADPDITWSHIVNLISIPVPAVRKRLAKKVVVEKLTAPELAHEIAAVFGNRRPGSGRKPGTPVSVTQAFSKLHFAIQKCHNVLARGIFCDDFDLPHRLETMPPDKVTAATRTATEENIRELRELAEQAADGAARLEQTLSFIDQALSTQLETKEQI